MLFTLILLFTISLGIFTLKRFVRSKYFRLIALIPFGYFCYFISFYFTSKFPESKIYFLNPWVRSLGISLDFVLDGLSMLFALLITGIGTLVFWYAAIYLRNHCDLHRFFGYLIIFMGAMLGLVLSENMLSLFLFWELTSLSSFFLIGFSTHDSNSRTSALRALSITGLGGFFLLISFVIMGSLTQSFSINNLLLNNELLLNKEHYYVILVCFFSGVFTKSAQFPFSYWLPGAMKAPTPVSAYLHSATMVKAGIYLLLRFSPILSSDISWNRTLLIVGAITMLSGAFKSIYLKDLKAILAQSTIASLGLLVFMIGIGGSLALFTACVFLVVHAFYKAGFFMLAGIIDHEFKTRDIRLLQGVKKSMPILAFSGFVLLLSSAGFPFTFGFQAKELLYQNILENNDWHFYTLIFLLVLAVVTNVFIIGSSAMVGLFPFKGNKSEKTSKSIKESYYFIAPVVLLTLFGILFGIFPQSINQLILTPAFKTIQFNNLKLHELHLWAGFNQLFLLSVLTLVFGIFLIFWLSKRISTENNTIENLSTLKWIQKINEWFCKLSFLYTRFFHNGYLRIYLSWITLFMVLLLGSRIFLSKPFYTDLKNITSFSLNEMVLFFISIAAIYTITFTNSRLTAIAATGLIGYANCLIFVYYGAPDLAMAQFAIDTLTVVLFMLILFRLPTYLNFKTKKFPWQDFILSIVFGLLVAFITLQALVYPSNKQVSEFYAQHAYSLAKGKNVVNVLLVDFRGFDTLIETIVLSIAAVGVFSILKYQLKDEKTE